MLISWSLQAFVSSIKDLIGLFIHRRTLIKRLIKENWFCVVFSNIIDYSIIRSKTETSETLLT
jgi:hypothetical protein